jgi:hypothetical protein
MWYLGEDEIGDAIREVKNSGRIIGIEQKVRNLQKCEADIIL